MHRSAQTGAERLEEVLASALQAAAQEAGRRANQVIISARLATAVRMSQAAEPASVPTGQAETSCVSSAQAASSQGTVAARLVRRGAGPGGDS